MVTCTGRPAGESRCTSSATLFPPDFEPTVGLDDIPNSSCSRARKTGVPPGASYSIGSFDPDGTVTCVGHASSTTFCCSYVRRLRSIPSPSSALRADFDVTPASAGASHSSSVAFKLSSDRSGRSSRFACTLSHSHRLRHCSVRADHPRASSAPIARMPSSIAGVVASGSSGANGASRSVALPTRVCRRHTTALLALAHVMTSTVSHRSRARHPSGSSADAGTGAATEMRSLRAPDAPAKASPASSATARTGSRESGSEVGTVAAPLSPLRTCAPDLPRRIATRSGYAVASRAPTSSTPSPKRKGNTGPAGSPSPTPGAKNRGAPADAEESSVERLRAASPASSRMSWRATLPASRAAARSTSAPS